MNSLARHQRVNMPVPECFAAASVADFEEHVLTRVPNSPESILITGGNGAGKSHLAAGIMRYWRVPWPKWASVLDISLWIKAAQARGSEDTDSAVVEDLLYANVLVIDDLLAGRLSDAALRPILHVVHGRIHSLRPTVVTSDHGLREIEQWDGSLASRLGGCLAIHLARSDRRIGPVAAKPAENYSASETSVQALEATKAPRDGLGWCSGSINPANRNGGPLEAS